jgi:hypothetical protein
LSAEPAPNKVVFIPEELTPQGDHHA